MAPSTLSMAAGSPSVPIGVDRPSSRASEYSCQPGRPYTRPPTGNLGLREATVRPTPLQRTTSPISTAGR